MRGGGIKDHTPIKSCEIFKILNIERGRTVAAKTTTSAGFIDIRRRNRPRRATKEVFLLRTHGHKDSKDRTWQTFQREVSPKQRSTWDYLHLNKVRADVLGTQPYLSSFILCTKLLHLIIQLQINLQPNCVWFVNPCSQLARSLKMPPFSSPKKKHGISRKLPQQCANHEALTKQDHALPAKLPSSLLSLFLL